MSLIDRASAIISEVSHTDDDIMELARIKWEMALLYWKTHILWAESEENFNKERASKYVQLMEEKMTQWDREKKAKESAEIAYWSYRAINAKANAIKESIRSIEWFCIAYYRKAKSEESASTNLQ